MTFTELGSSAGAAVAIIVFLTAVWRIFRTMNTMIEYTEDVPKIKTTVSDISAQLTGLRSDVGKVSIQQNILSEAFLDHQGKVAADLADHQASVAVSLMHHQEKVALSLIEYQTAMFQKTEALEMQHLELLAGQQTSIGHPTIGKQIDDITDNLQPNQEL